MVYVYICACMYIHAYVYMYVHMYTYMLEITLLSPTSVVNMERKDFICSAETCTYT